MVTRLPTPTTEHSHLTSTSLWSSAFSATLTQGTLLALSFREQREFGSCSQFSRGCDCGDLEPQMNVWPHSEKDRPPAKLAWVTVGVISCWESPGKQ